MVSGVRVRAGLGLLAVGASIGAAVVMHGARGLRVPILFACSWAIAVALTDKYRHKYPYRFYAYLIASHTKAAIIFAIALSAGLVVTGSSPAERAAAWSAFLAVTIFDLSVAIPRRETPHVLFDPAVLTSRGIAAQAEMPAASSMPRTTPAPQTSQSFAIASAALQPKLVSEIRAAVPKLENGTPTVVIDGWARARDDVRPASAELVICTMRVNDARRINRLFLRATDALQMGGHFVCRYEPLESRRAIIERRFGGAFLPAFLAHFAVYRVWPKVPYANKLYFVLTRGRNRVVSKAEVWGRLSFCGLRVTTELADGAERIVIAQKCGDPITNRKPSYYPVVGLTKVGLDGEMLRTHKVRSMYPFSEFLQKQIFETNGLVGTGKFRDDFRLTEYGKFLRRHWIDELPQLYDWLRGDIKLVGMRATSPHFLSLYPQDFIRLYSQIKPGLIPPLFDEGTEGFDAILAIEFAYLREYLRAPNRTDITLFLNTVKAITRGVRSK